MNWLNKEETKRKNNLLIIAAVLVILFLLGCMAYFVWSRNKYKELYESKIHNTEKNDAVIEERKQQIRQREPYRDSIVKERKAEERKLEEIKDERAKIKPGYKKLFDEIKNINGNYGHMRLGDSVISEWDKRQP